MGQIGFPSSEYNSFPSLSMVISRNIFSSKQLEATTRKYISRVRANITKQKYRAASVFKWDNEFSWAYTLPHPKVSVTGPKCSSFLFLTQPHPWSAARRQWMQSKPPTPHALLHTRKAPWPMELPWSCTDKDTDHWTPPWNDPFQLPLTPLYGLFLKEVQACVSPLPMLDSKSHLSRGWRAGSVEEYTCSQA